MPVAIAERGPHWAPPSTAQEGLVGVLVPGALARKLKATSHSYPRSPEAEGDSLIPSFFTVNLARQGHRLSGSARRQPLERVGVILGTIVMRNIKAGDIV